VKHSLIGKETGFLHTLAQNLAGVQQVTIQLLKHSQLGLLWISIFHLYHYPFCYPLHSTKAEKKIGKTEGREKLTVLKD